MGAKRPKSLVYIHMKTKQFHGTLDIISNNHPFKDGCIRFTLVHLKPLSNHYRPYSSPRLNQKEGDS